MGCIASCTCCGRNQIQLTEQQIQLRGPADEVAEDADRFRRVRLWVMSIEDISKEAQIAAMEKYLTMTFSDYDNDGGKSPFRKSMSGTARSLESDTISPNSNVQTPRITAQSGENTLCQGSSSFAAGKFKISRNPSLEVFSAQVGADGNLLSSETLPVDTVQPMSISVTNKKPSSASDGEISLGKSEGHVSGSKESQLENGHYDLKKQATLPGRTVRSNSPSGRKETLKWSHS